MPMAEETSPSFPQSDRDSVPEVYRDRLNAEEPRSEPPTVAPNRRPAASLSGVTPFPIPKPANSTPILPKVTASTGSDRRHAANPEFTLDLLQEIQQMVINWQQELQSLHQQIEDIYRQGPMINGWLESHSRENSERPITSLRHADIEELMSYIEKLSEEDTDSNLSPVAYKLCGLDEQGKLWSKPCPAEQIPSVSLAISRYQKVKQLLKRKQILEQKIIQLGENLIVCSTNLQEQ
jgi:hypothetical protein